MGFTSKFESKFTGRIIGKLIGIFICLLGLSGGLCALEGPDFLQLHGKSLFSFTPDHFVVQTDNYFYKISKKNLSADLLKKLESATLSNESIVVKIPTKTIEYVWPTVLLTSRCCWSGKSKADYEEATTDLSANVIRNNGQIKLSGKLVLSIAEPYYLIQVNNEIYQLKKSALSKKQENELKKINLGGRVSISIPQTAVNYSWSFKQQASRSIASVEEADEATLNKSYMTLKGTVLYSANEPTVIVQSKNLVYQLKRKDILTKKTNLLDINGSKIQLIVPVTGIEFFWSTDGAKLVNITGPK